MLKRPNKYGARKASHGGYVYHSQKEAKYAYELDLRVLAGELKSWKRQVPLKMVINGKTVCTYHIDFVEEGMDGSLMYTEVKGFDTDVWRLKWKLFEALHPEKAKQVIR